VIEERRNKLVTARQRHHTSHIYSQLFDTKSSFLRLTYKEIVTFVKGLSVSTFSTLKVFQAHTVQLNKYQPQIIRVPLTSYCSYRRSLLTLLNASATNPFTQLSWTRE